MKTIIISSQSKSCNVDPLPTILLKACLDLLIIPNADVINTNVCSGLFPEDFKYAHVNPGVKKTSPPKEQLKIYRSISSLIIVLFEEVAANRLMCYSMHTNNFIP